MKLWFSLFDRNDYKGNDPAFFNPDEYQFSKIIIENYPIFKEELANYLQKHELQSYFNASMVTKANTWKTIGLRTWDVNIYQDYNYFPKTLQVINSIPGLVSASFNLLEPHGHIIPHCGDTNGIFRCHLGLNIPDKIPACGFRVKDEWRSWEEGKLLVFTDANNHEAINNTSQNRFIFLFDIIREEALPKKRFICATVLTSLFLQKWAQILKIKNTPMWLQVLLAKFFTPLAYIAIPLRNFFYQFNKG